MKIEMRVGVAIAAGERARVERLCRYVSRPPVASERLALTASGQVRYALKTPYRDGTTHIVLEPLTTPYQGQDGRLQALIFDLDGTH